MRRDIQLLRGLAVLLVVIFHADLGVVRHGYLGVDVFFVISGFLITTIILKAINSNNFSFSAFYLRRAKRLLPALYSTLAITAFLSYWFITSTQWYDFVAQLVGSLTFTSNLVLPTQIGYFERAAEGKPLLHIWSLSLEEQYYFFLPLVLFFTPKSKQLVVLIFLTIGSLAWCLSWVSETDAVPPFLWRFSEASISEWAFYLFPTRAWELLAGSVCAWLMINKSISVSTPIKVSSLLTIVVVSCISFDPLHPRGDAIIVVFATSLILLGNNNWLPKGRLVHYMEKMGDWSYSIYLVHFPIFAFAYLGYLGNVPFSTKVTLIFVSLLLGYGQYRFVETPFRHGWSKKSSRTWIWLGFSTLAVILILAPMALNVGSSSTKEAAEGYAEMRKWNTGLSKNCDQFTSDLGVKPECLLGEKPEVAVWGDSFAMHLVPGLAKTGISMMQVTKSACGPIVGLSPIYENYTRDWAEKCSKFNRTAFQIILNTDSITHVVLSSTFNQYFNSSEGQFFISEKVVQKNSLNAMESLILTLEKLKAAGKIPILISPPPRSGFDIGECLERNDMGLISFKGQCDVLVSDYLEYEREIRSALKYVAGKARVKVIWLDKLLCDQEVCKTKINGTYVYRDGGHLTVAGSEILLSNIDLKAKGLPTL